MTGNLELTEEEEKQVDATLARIRSTLPSPDLLQTEEPPHFFTPEALNVDLD